MMTAPEREAGPITKAAGFLLLGVLTGSLCTLMIAVTIAIVRVLLG